MTNESEAVNLPETIGEIVVLLDRAWECGGEESLELAESVERLLARLQVRAMQTPFGAEDVAGAEPSLSLALHQNEEDFRAFLAHVGSHPEETTEHFGMARFRCHVLRRLIRLVYGASPQDQLPFLISEGRSLERQLHEDEEGEEPLASLRDFRTEILCQRAAHLLHESTALKTQADVDGQLELAFVVGRGLNSISQQLQQREGSSIESSALEEELRTEWHRLRQLLLHAVSHVEEGEDLQQVRRIGSLLESELDELRLESYDSTNPLPLEQLGSEAADGKRFSAALRDASRQHSELSGTAKRTRGLARRITDIRNDRILRNRLEGLFSRRLVVFWESLVFWLIIFVLFLIFYDQATETSDVGWTMWVDTGICFFLMLDFLMRLALTPNRWRYFFRNALTDFLPSLPLGLLANLERVGWISGVRALRLVRAFRVLRFLRPLIRLVRLMLFAIRAMDRVVARNARWLNRNIVFFADPDGKDETPPLVTRVREMDAWISRELRGMQTQLPLRVRMPATEWRVRLMQVTARHCTSDAALIGGAASAEAGGDVDVEDVVDLLRSLDDTQVAELIGPEVARQITSSLRFFRIPFLRRLPVVNFVLGPTGAPDPLMTTARLGHVMGELLSRIQRSVLWFADLYGTITGAQFLDRLGLSLVRATSRPAKRLLMFGVIALVMLGLVRLTQMDALQVVFGKVLGFLSLPVLVLGGLCLIPLLIGVWFRRIAGQAVDFYERVAEAQFLSLTEIRKEAFALERLDDLTDRVILPEAQLKESVDESAQLSIRAEIKRRAEGEEAAPDDSTTQSFEWIHGDSMLLFFRDFLDGAFFHQNDTKIANLLQGNLTLENIRKNRLRLSKKELKKLGRLDLARGRGGLFGPYAWFNFITHSVAQKTARLIIDYNRFCIPMDERAVTNADDLSQFNHWIGTRRAQYEADATANEPTIDARSDDNDIHDLAYRTTEFNALHFLDCDDVRDAAVERRFGAEVRELLELDRVHLIREIFGSYPVHAFSRDRRTLNPFVFHQRYLASGRVFLFPLRLGWLAVRLFGGFLKRVAIVVRDVLNPDGAAIRKAPLADFETARRKIHRMRRPVVMETVLLRARFDGQYLGLRFTESGVPLPKEHLLESDLLRLSATEREWKRYREIKDEAEQRLRSLRRVALEAGTPDGDLSQSADLIAASPEGRGVESVRAAVIAFLTDHRGIASVVASRERLQKLNALAQKGLLSRRWRSAFAGSAKSLMARVEAIWPHVASEEVLSDESAKAVFASALRTRWGQEHQNVKLLQEALPEGVSVATHVMGVLCGVASNPSSWSDQLVALRSVQSLGLMDLEGYEELIARLGRFAAPEPDGEVVARRL